jgi:hypothetical protein
VLKKSKVTEQSGNGEIYTEIFHLRSRIRVLDGKFLSNNELAARLEVVRGSWKGLQNPFPASVQADVRLGMFTQ